LQIDFKYPVELNFNAVSVGGAVITTGSAFTAISGDKKSYTLAVEAPTSARTGETVTVSVDLNLLGADPNLLGNDYAYQLAHNDQTWTKGATVVTVPRSIASISAGETPTGYSTAYIQFTLDHNQYPIEPEELEGSNKGRVVIEYADGTSPTINDIVRIDADMGYTFRALITPTQSGAVSVYIDDFGITSGDVTGATEHSDNTLPDPEYYLDENGNNYLMTTSDAYQQLPGLTLGGDGPVYDAPAYTLRTNAEYDGWEVSVVYADGAALAGDRYSTDSEPNRPYILDGKNKGPIAKQLLVTLNAGWTETNGEHRIVTVLTGKAGSGNDGRSVALSGKLTVAGLTPTYTLTVTGGSGSGKYPANRSVAIAASEPPAGKAFYKWNIEPDGSGALGDPYAPSTNYVMPANNIAVKAEYMDRHPTPAAQIA
jgi:hypothetical protein